MRVSTTLLQRQAAASIREQQAEVEDTRERLASGRRLLSPSEDPSGTERLARLTRGLEELRQFGANADRVTERLELEESTLASITNTLQRVRELAIRAGNAGLTDGDRASIAVELEGTLDTLVDLANTRDADGQALFAGTRSDVVPWVRGAGGVLYDGDDAVRRVRVGPDAFVADGHSGLEAFGSARAGNGVFETGAVATNTGTGRIDRGNLAGTFLPDDYRIEIVAGAGGRDYRVLDGGGAVVTSGAYVDGGAIEFAGVRVVVSGEAAVGDAFTVAASRRITMFEAVEGLVAAVASGASAPAARALNDDARASALADVDAVLGRVLDVRADVGARLGLVAVQKDLGERLALTTEEAASSIRDVDVVEAVIRLESQATTLEAAQRAFARLQGLSLFRFLN